MKLTAVQMIGTQRSGSNLLRLMLNQLPEVSSPHPPHILERFIPLLSLYGDLSVAVNFKRLATDVCELVRCNPVTWTNIILDIEKIISQCNENTLLEITRVIYEQKAKQDGASIWICKSMANIHYINELETSLQPKYIFLYRDGRDVACSFKKAVVGEKHVYQIAKQWKDEQEKCLALKAYLGNTRFLSVCYEQLIADPETELQRICSFIGIEYNPECLQYYRSGEAQNTASSGFMWRNVKQEVLPGNFNKYKKELSPDDTLLFERVAGRTLLILGYPLQFAEALEPYVFSPSEIDIYALQNTQLKQAVKKNQTVEEAAKREKQEALLASLKSGLHNINLQPETISAVAV